MSGAALGNALTQISGETATGSQQTTFDAMGLFLGLLTDPFVAGATAQGVGCRRGAVERLRVPPRKSAPRAMPMPCSPRRRRVTPFEQRWSAWAAGYGGSQTTDGNATFGSNTVTSSIYGTAVGADYRFSPFTIAGFALAGGGTNFSVANGWARAVPICSRPAHSFGTQLGRLTSPRQLAYGWQDITTNRTVTVAGIDQPCRR